MELESSSSVVGADRHDCDVDLDSDMLDCYWTLKYRHSALKLVVHDRAPNRANIYCCSSVVFRMNAADIDDIALKPAVFYHSLSPFRDTYFYLLHQTTKPNIKFPP